MSEFNERSKRQIALLAGDDLEGVATEEVRESIESCPKCRGHWIRVRGCLDLMERVGKEGPDPIDVASLWPALEPRLRRPVVLRAERFNGWIPALSMAAACIALMIAGQLETPPAEFSDGSFPAERPATSPMLSLIGNPLEVPEQMVPASPGPTTHEWMSGQDDVRGFVSPFGDRPVSPIGGSPR